MTSESKSQVRVFSLFPTLPDVNLDGVHEIHLESNQKLSHMKYRVANAGCDNFKFSDSHIPVTKQMDNKYNYPKKEVNTAQLELNTPSDIAKSFFPQAASLGNLRSRRSTEKDEPQNRKRRLIDAVAALPVGTRFSVGEPFKETACNALSIFFLCDSREHLD